MEEAVKHYDKKYFSEHYGAIIENYSYYKLLASYWVRAIFDPLKVYGVTKEYKVLDYGCGTGVVSAGLNNSTVFDVAPFAQEFLKECGRSVVCDVSLIPKNTYDVILCSHSLEHYEDPWSVLHSFREFVRPSGYLILVLPIDSDFTPTITPDNNQHFYGWNFQSITNLLLHCGWTPQASHYLYSPYLLRTLGRWVSNDIAVSVALKLGSVKRAFKSMLVLAQLAD